MNSINSVNVFNGWFAILLIGVLIATGFAANAYYTGTQELNSYAEANSDDFFNGNLGREILNK